MKFKILFIGLIYIAAAYVFSGCSDDNANTNRPLMTGLVDGSNWRCPEPNARISPNQILVYGTSASGQTIKITIYEGSEGVYTLSKANTHEGIFIPNTSSFATIYSTSNSEKGSGQVRISSIDEQDQTISGTFSFKAYKSSSSNSKNITNGEFTKVPYKFLNNDDSPATDILTANVDGVNFNSSNISGNKSNGLIEIVATQTGTSNVISLMIPDTITSGSHTIDATTGPVKAVYSTGNSTYPATDGSMTISSHNTQTQVIKGSFFFNAENTSGNKVEISAGYFESQY